MHKYTIRKRLFIFAFQINILILAALILTWFWNSYLTLLAPIPVWAAFLIILTGVLLDGREK